MQVKKFAAKTMKEAIQLVKDQLGPEAVILSVKDNYGGFGLGGKGGVEVTAAISDGTLQKKRYAEEKLNATAKEKYQTSSAKSQKVFITKAVQQYADEMLSSRQSLPTQTRYADILDETADRMVSGPSNAMSLSPRSLRQPTANKMFEKVPQVSTVTSKSRDGKKIAKETKTHGTDGNSKSSLPASNTEVVSLRQEIHYLRQVIDGLKKIPQTFVSLHPGAERGIPFSLSFLYEKFLSSGISSDFVMELLQRAQKEISPTKLENKLLIEAWAARRLLESIDICPEPNTGFFHGFVGASGQGKTTTLVKFASHLAVHEKRRVVLLTADTFKVGGADQLKIFAQILNVPFAVVRTEHDLYALIKKYKNMDAILMDYPSLHLKTESDIQWMKKMVPRVDHLFQNSGSFATLGESQPKICFHLVQSAIAKDFDAFTAAHRFAPYGLTDFIMTFLDEAIQHGIICNLQQKLKLPLHSFSTGPNIPDDYEMATAERVLDLIFKLRDVLPGDGAKKGARNI